MVDKCSGVASSKQMIKMEFQLIQCPQAESGLCAVASATAIETLCKIASETPTYNNENAALRFVVLDFSPVSVGRLFEDGYLRASSLRRLQLALNKRRPDGTWTAGVLDKLHQELLPWWQAITGSSSAMRAWMPDVELRLAAARQGAQEAAYPTQVSSLALSHACTASSSPPPPNPH